MQGPTHEESRDFAIAAVKKNGNALKHASAQLRSDREVVLAAVCNDGNTMLYASPELKADREFVMQFSAGGL